MSKSIRSFLSFLLVLQLIIPYATFAASIGEFTSVVGKVTQTRAKEVVIPVVKSPIQLKDLIVTDSSSSATMVFSDDSTIMLSGNSKLEIGEFLLKDKSRKGIFSLAVGKLTANVKKYIGGDNYFEVRSPTAVAGVRGTGFEFVEALKDSKVGSNVGNPGVATVTCKEGSLTLSALSAAGKVVSTGVLGAGQTAVITGGVITISAVAAAMAGAGAGLAGASGTGTGVAAGGAAGGAAVATGLSTAAISGLAIGGAAVVIGTAAALSSSGTSKSTVTTTTGGQQGVAIDRPPTTVDGSGSVTSLNPTICVTDFNSIYDDYYDLYVNGAFIGAVHNAVGGSTCYPVVLNHGNNTVKLKLTQINYASTGARITANPGGFSSDFFGSYDHTWNISAP